MKSKKTILFAVVALLFASSVYYATVYKENHLKKILENESKIVFLDPDQINYIELINRNAKIVFHKNESGWSIQEPVLDNADNYRMLDVIKNLTSDQYVLIAKEGTDIKWSEFGLDKPIATYLFKNNSGQSQKIQISDLKNYEDLPYARVDNNDQVLVVKPQWLSNATQKLVYYRDKRLYRGSVAAVETITIKSLNGEFNLQKQNGIWGSVEKPDFKLDQEIVRKMIKDIADTPIQDYLGEGEISKSETKDKKLNQKDAHKVQFKTQNDQWSVVMNLHDTDKSLYAMTDRPTYLVKLDLSKWEFFSNLNLDYLRDRKEALRFDISKVKDITFKLISLDQQLTKKNKNWVETNNIDNQIDSEKIEAVLDVIHDMTIDSFVTDSESTKFEGREMIILKNDDDQLILQLNWGPSLKKMINGTEKEFYLARTQLSDLIFALDKNKIDQIKNTDIKVSKKATDDKN